MKETNNSIIIFGAGGHAKSVISIIEAEAKWQIYGLLVEPEYLSKQSSVLGYKVIGDTSYLSQLQQVNIRQGFVAIGDNQLRALIADDMLSQGIQLVKVIHPTAVIMKNTEIGSGSMIHAQAVIGAECRIGNNAIISSTTVVGHDSYISDYAHLTPGVLIGGGASIGEFSFLGLGAAVLPNVKIGRNVRVGANSVVHKDLGNNVVVAGNPARIVKRDIPLIRACP